VKSKENQHILVLGIMPLESNVFLGCYFRSLGGERCTRPLEMPYGKLARAKISLQGRPGRRDNSVIRPFWRPPCRPTTSASDTCEWARPSRYQMLYFCITIVDFIWNANLFENAQLKDEKTSSLLFNYMVKKINIFSYV
jgi:hypothetical protein